MAIVCGTDFSEDAKRAARASLGLAGPLGDEVLLVHAMELPTVAFIAGEGLVMPPAVPPPNLERLKQELDEKLADEARRLGPHVKPVLAIGTPVEALMEEVRRYDARLLVVGSHGTTGAARWLLGSTADRLARSASVPLLVVRGDADRFVAWSQRRRPLKVLVCVDFQDATDSVVSTALSFCTGGDCTFHFAHSFEQTMSPFAVWGGGGPSHPSTQSSELEHRVNDELARVAARIPSGTPDRVHILRGKPAVALARFAREEHFDLIVCGTHSRHGLERMLLGSVAIGLLHRAPCPVVVAPIGPQPLPRMEPRPEEEATVRFLPDLPLGAPPLD